jgi:hypothetical protein
MPKGTNTFGHSKARACESSGFVSKKGSFDTASSSGERREPRERVQRMCVLGSTRLRG